MESKDLKILFFYKNNKNYGKIIVKINFFRYLEINKSLTTVQRMFIWEKQLNLSKNTKLCFV